MSQKKLSKLVLLSLFSLLSVVGILKTNQHQITSTTYLASIEYITPVDKNKPIYEKKKAPLNKKRKDPKKIGKMAITAQTYFWLLAAGFWAMGTIVMIIGLTSGGSIIPYIVGAVCILLGLIFLLVTLLIRARINRSYEEKEREEKKPSIRDFQYFNNFLKMTPFSKDKT